MTTEIDTTDGSVVAVCAELIRNRCVNDGTPDSGNERRSVTTITDLLGPGAEVVEPHQGRASVAYRLPGTDPSAPTLMLMGHLDVVPVVEEGWSRDPFGAEVVDGVLWGRGAVDMLNVTAAMTVVAKRVIDGNLPTPPGGFVYLAVADEEAGGDLGVRWMFDHRPELVACDDLLTEIAYPRISLGGTPVQPVMVAEKGPSWRTLTSKGEAGHASAPLGRSNAMDPLVDAAVRLLGADTTPHVGDDWRAFIAALDLDAETAAALVDPDRVDGVIEAFARTQPGIGRYLHACTRMTVAPTTLHVGEKANTIPSAGAMTIDMRLLPGQDPEVATAHLDTVLGPLRARLGDVVHQHASGSASPPTGKLWRALVSAYDDVAGATVLAPTMAPASTDGRFFRTRGVNAYGAGWFADDTDFGTFLDMFHGHDERIAVTSLERTVDLLSAAVEAYAATP